MSGNENKKEQSGGYASWLAELATTDSDVEALKASGALTKSENSGG